MNIDNISGHPKSFTASYAKDIIVALIESRHYADKKQKEILEDFTIFANEIHDWIMSDTLEPMTDVQYSFIEEIMIAKKYTDKMIEAVKNNIRKYTIAEASDLIDKMLNDEELPPEYKDYMGRQKDAMKATQHRVFREQ